MRFAHAGVLRWVRVVVGRDKCDAMVVPQVGHRRLFVRFATINRGITGESYGPWNNRLIDTVRCSGYA